MNEIKMNFIGLSVREKRRKVHFIGSIVQTDFHILLATMCMKC